MHYRITSTGRAAGRSISEVFVFASNDLEKPCYLIKGGEPWSKMFSLFQDITELCGGENEIQTEIPIEHNCQCKKSCNNMVKLEWLNKQQIILSILYYSVFECAFYGLQFQHYVMDSYPAQTALFLICVQLFQVFYMHPPSIPILPSPSLSPAAIRVLVSATVSSLAPGEKFWRNSLTGAQKISEISSDLYHHRLYILWCHFLFPSRLFWAFNPPPHHSLTSTSPHVLLNSFTARMLLHSYSDLCLWAITTEFQCRCSTHAQTHSQAHLYHCSSP